MGGIGPVVVRGGEGSEGSEGSEGGEGGRDDDAVRDPRDPRDRPAGGGRYGHAASADARRAGRLRGESDAVPPTASHGLCGLVQRPGVG
ncbi:hypothetical protein DIE16_18790 [Burkholderia sp. Bp9090]|nr:hypothetical protein DIE16_18790 [Burkholderia sp. Bp9090]